MTTTQTTTATFTKLRTGAWGVKGRGLRAGQAVTVTKRDGATSTVTIDRVTWTGSDGVQLASIADTRLPQARTTRIGAETRTQARGGNWSVRRQYAGSHCQMCGNERWDCDC